ncbi:MAG: hypothetical protein GY801_08425 [bacterium]|nr:hypothetical protein [bacterium]
MNVRERFLEVMLNFNRHVTPPKWEFGYWGGAINSWYASGLPKIREPEIPTETITSTSSLYIPSWNSVPKGHLPEGYAVLGGSLYWPTQGFAVDHDVKHALNMDTTITQVDVECVFHPHFDVEFVDETEEIMTYIDIDGVKRAFHKGTGVIPTFVEGVIKDWNSWEKLKEERLNLNDVKGRLPANWAEQVKAYKDRDYVVNLGGYPNGCFGTLAQLIGYDHLFYLYYDDPKLVHDILSTFTDVWIAVYSEVLAEVEVDVFTFWEDISAGTGSMVAPKTIKEFMLPYYKKITAFLKSNGVDVIFIDTDGDCVDLIPIFLEGGITGMYPLEASCGVDIVKVRKDFPELQMMGGIPKYEIKYGKQRTDEILEPVAEVLKTGGYVPFGDHLIPPDIPWEHFTYYREKLNGMLESFAKN